MCALCLALLIASPGAGPTRPSGQAAERAAREAAERAAGEARMRRLLQALGQDGSPKVRAQAALLLGQARAAAAAKGLVAALSDDGAVAVRAAAAIALGRIGGSGAVAALRSAMAHDAHGAVRQAAARALDEVLSGARSVTIDAVQGDKGDAATRSRLRDALAGELARRGFAVVAGGGEGAYRLKPTVLLLEVSQGSGAVSVQVKASVVAVDRQGRVSAMVEGGARAEASLRSGPPGQLTAQVLDAAARNISEDLARRLLEHQ